MLYDTLLTFIFQYSDFISVQENINTFLRNFVECTKAEQNITLLVCIIHQINYKGKTNKLFLTGQFKILHKHLVIACHSLYVRLTSCMNTLNNLKYKQRGRGYLKALTDKINLGLFWSELSLEFKNDTLHLCNILLCDSTEK
jgi:hypothetical protein